MRKTKHGVEYLVKWTGYREKTWEKVENLEGARRAIELFWQKRKKLSENEDEG
jgi:hypothetical protein